MELKSERIVVANSMQKKKKKLEALEFQMNCNVSNQKRISRNFLKNEIKNFLKYCDHLSRKYLSYICVKIINLIIPLHICSIISALF